MLKAIDRNTPLEFGSNPTLANDCTKGILKSMVWIKRKGTLRNLEPSLQLLAEEKFIFQKAISAVVYHHEIPANLIINFNHTLHSYICSGNYTFE